jgi:CubicO group peptidase (beta-lactamase class C family)
LRRGWRFRRRPLLFEPGIQYRYSTYGWILVSAAVEAAASEPFFTFIPSGEETGYGFGWDLETVSIAGETMRQVGHDGEFFIGGSTSFITFPERGIVVAVTSNISFADTSSLALKIAKAFAEPGKR